MAQELTVNIKTTSDVPQAMDKAKAATISFDKQVQDIGKKFGTSFKDIFLSFLGPMALVTGSIALIGRMIEENERKRAEANKAAIDGTNELMSTEDKYWARKTEREKKVKQTEEEARIQRETTTQQFLENDPRGQAMLKELQFKGLTFTNLEESKSFNKQKAIQEQVQAILAEDYKNDPITKLEEAQRKQKLAEERIKKEEEEARIRAAKDRAKKEAASPMAYSVSGNVIGVGANPVVTALQEQQVIAREQLAVLQVIASNGMQGASVDVTASGATPRTPANASPSRAALLTKNK